MMKILVDKERIVIGKDSVRYNSVYLSQNTIKNLIKTWIDRIQTLKAEKSVFFPYSIDDEYVEAFIANLDHGEIVLRCVTLDGIGYDHGIDETVKFMTGSLPLVEQRNCEFGRYRKDDILAAMKDFLNGSS